MGGDVDVLAALGRLYGRRAALVSGMQKPASSVSGLQAGQELLGATVTRLRLDVRDRTGRLREKVTQLGDESVVNYAGSSTVGKKLSGQANISRDGTDQLSAMFGMTRPFDERLNALKTTPERRHARRFQPDQGSGVPGRAKVVFGSLFGKNAFLTDPPPRRVRAPH